MRYVRLAKAEEITIVEMRKFHTNPRVRERAQMVELSNRDKSIDEIVEIVEKTRKTVSLWLTQYERYGISGLFDDERSGRNPKVKDPIKDKIIEIAKSDHTCTSGYIARIIEEEFGIKLHSDTIKYHLKKRKVRLQKNQKQPKGEKRWVKIR